MTKGGTADGFGATLRRLQQAQKSARGGQLYSLWVNRRLGRLLAAASYQAGLSPNQVTYISAVLTFAGICMLALAPPTWLVGGIVTVFLVLGYAFDSADGQLARLRGGGSLLGEWLDHTIDSVKVSVLHVAVLVMCYRHFDLHPAWLLVPLSFGVASAVHFFGMILVDLLARIRRATLGAPPPRSLPAHLLTTILKLPMDYGILCLSFLLLGADLLFFIVYTLLALATCAYTVLVIGKWRRDVIALDALGADPAVSRGP